MTTYILDPLNEGWESQIAAVPIRFQDGTVGLHIRDVVDPAINSIHDGQGLCWLPQECPHRWTCPPGLNGADALNRFLGGNPYWRLLAVQND